MALMTNPKEIEDRSFKIVDRFLKDIKLPELEKDVVKRVLHATSDLRYAKELLFHPEAIKKGVLAIKSGKNVIVDANMVKAGINNTILSSFGGKVICFISNKDIIKKSSQLNITRAILAMRKAAKLMDGGIVAIGNAPTALFELCDLVEEGKTKPALIIGLPVGFVGAKEAKKKLVALGVPYITNQSRKGGSSVAVAIVNALLKIAGSFAQ